MTAHALTKILASLAAVVTLGFVFFASRGSGFALWPLFIGFALWAVAPYVVLWFSARRAADSGLWSWIVAGATIVLAVFAIYFYWVGFIQRPDAQSGLLFVFLPLYQLAAAGVLFVASVLVRGRRT